MKNFSKILSFITVFVVAFVLVGCVNTATKSAAKPTNTTTTAKPTTKTTTKHEHSFTGDYQKDATNHWKTCSCGEQQKEAHTFGEWTVVTEATVDADGSKKRVCSVCSYEETGVIPQLGKLAKPEIELDAATGEVTFTADENALKYQYKLAYSEKGYFGEWADVPAAGLEIKWGDRAIVKAIAKEGFADSDDSNEVARIYNNKVEDGKFMGHLDNAQADPNWVVSYNDETHINHITAKKELGDWAAFIAKVTGSTKDMVAKITISNIEGVPAGSNPQLILKWNDDGDATAYVNLVEGTVFFGGWNANTADLTKLPIMITGTGKTSDISFDMVIKFEKVSSTETYVYNKETKKVEYTKTWMDSEYHANETKSLDVESKTLEQLLALTKDSEGMVLVADKNGNNNYYTSKPYLLDCYVSEIQGGTDQYGNAYVIDEAKNLGCIYGMQPLNSGSIFYKLNDSGDIELGTFYGKKKFQDIINDVHEGDLVTLLVQVELYKENQFEILCELVEVKTAGALQAAGAQSDTYKTTPEVVEAAHITTTLDKEKYAFGENVVISLSEIDDPTFVVKSVVVQRQSKNSKMTLTLKADETTGKYTYKAGVQDTITVTLESKYNVTSEVYAATQTDEGLEEGKLYVKLTYALKEGQTGEVPAPEYIKLNETTVDSLNSKAADATLNETDYAPFVLDAYVTGYSKGNGTLVGYGEFEGLESIVLYGCAKPGSWKFGRVDTWNAETEAYDKYLTATTGGDNAEVQEGAYCQLIGVYCNYFGKREAICQLVKVYETAPEQCGISAELEENADNAEVYSAIDVYDVLDKGTSYSDGSSVVFTKNNDGSYSCATKKDKYFGWNTLTVPADAEYFVFTLTCPVDFNFSYKIDDANNSCNNKQVNVTQKKGTTTYLIKVSDILADPTKIVKFCMWGYNSTNDTVVISTAKFIKKGAAIEDPTTINKNDIVILTNVTGKEGYNGGVTIKHLDDTEDVLKAYGKDYVFVAQFGDTIKLTASESGYGTAAWELIESKTAASGYAVAYVAHKLDTNTDPKAPEIQVVGEKSYDLDLKSAKEAIEVKKSSYLFLTYGYVVNPQNSVYGNGKLATINQDGTISLLTLNGTAKFVGDLKAFEFVSEPTSTAYVTNGKYSNQKSFLDGENTIISEGEFVVLLGIKNSNTQFSGYLVQKDATKNLSALELKFLPTIDEIEGKDAADNTTKIEIKDAVSAGYTFGTEVELVPTLAEGYTVTSIKVVRVGENEETITPVEGKYLYKVGMNDTIKMAVALEGAKIISIDFSKKLFTEPSTSIVSGELVVNDVTFAYSGVKTASGTTNDKLYAYMFMQAATASNVCFFTNKDALNGKIVSVKVTTTSGTAGSGKIYVTLGKAALNSEILTGTNADITTTNGVANKVNATATPDDGYNYFNVSCDAKNVQIESIEITYIENPAE